MVIQFKVNEQKITLLSNPWVVGNSYNYVRAQFNFISDDWDSLPKTAIFTNGSREYPVTLDRNDQCKVPWEVLEPNEFHVYVIGGSPASEMITTNTISIDVHPSTSCGKYYNFDRNPTPDIYQQILDLLQDKQDKLIAGDNIDISDDNVISGTTDYIDEKVDDINIRIDGLENSMIDTIMLDKDTNELWLSANGEQVGDKVVLPIGESGRGVNSVSINDEGHMIISYSDGTSEDIGKVTYDGKTYVYVPTIDDRKVLTLTLSESPGVESISCDLNPNDEWIEITDNPTSSDYIWEEL